MGKLMQEEVEEDDVHVMLRIPFLNYLKQLIEKEVEEE